MNVERLPLRSQTLLCVEDSEPAQWDVSGADYVRVALPASRSSARIMERAGYRFADRTLDVSVRLSAAGDGFDKLCRMPVIESMSYLDDVRRIACASFPNDSRFHVSAQADANVAAQLIEAYVARAERYLVCLYQNRAVGFLGLKRLENGVEFVHLAAVEAAYRATGAAISLYANAAKLAKLEGAPRLEGRISSANTAVMNLYACLGASFSNPQDVFLKENEQ